jgi:hypothetical protein
MPMIVMTMISSMSVKPDCVRRLRMFLVVSDQLSVVRLFVPLLPIRIPIDLSRYSF